MELIVRYHEKLRACGGKKTEALYLALKEAIAEGAFAAGSRLPSTREFAREYGLSRGGRSARCTRCWRPKDTSKAKSAGGDGRAVRRRSAAGGDCGVRPDSAVGMGAPNRRSPALASGGCRSGEREGGEREGGGLAANAASGGGRAIPVPGGLSFAIGIPDWRRFPHQAWSRCLYAEIRRGFAASSRDADAAGDPALREAIAAHLRRSRGLAVAVGDIVIVNGSMQAIALLVQLLAGPGDRVAAEDPGYGGMRRAVLAAGAELLPAAVDGEGVVPDDWDARLLLVTPGRQFPTGALLPMERRLQLLEWAQERQAIIVEDDYDTEFRHAGRPLEPLKALDRSGRVAFVGTFSKTMYPSLRIGYAVLPPDLREPFVRAMQLYEPQPAGLLQQRALAAFMRRGDYERHIRRMKRTYARRFRLLSVLVEGRLGRLFSLVPTQAGLHLFVWWKEAPESFSSFRAACADQGLHVPLLTGISRECRNRPRSSVSPIWTRRRSPRPWP